MGAANLLGNKRIDADFVPNKRRVLLDGQKLNLNPGPYIQKSRSLNFECLGHLYEKLPMKMGPFL